MVNGKEIIVVRSLKDSDLGLFAVHRPATRSKQRAININAQLAARLVAPAIFATGGAEFDSICVFGSTVVSGRRHFGKVGKNWRLGGKKIEGNAFANLDSADFALIRSPEHNDGTAPITITFISRKTDRITHAGLAAIVGRVMKDSMALYDSATDGFADIIPYCATGVASVSALTPPGRQASSPARVPPMPRDDTSGASERPRTIHEKIRSSYMMERMLKAAADLSAPAQLRFIETVEQLASQLREILLATGGIINIRHGHQEFWKSVAGLPIGFVDGGLANLSMLGSAPIAARVGGYLVTPGDKTPAREQFTMLKHLIDDLYAHAEGGVYDDVFPDIGALRDAARISIEAAGVVQMLQQAPVAKWVLLHGSLVNPVSRYTDVMESGQIRHRFPNFSNTALCELLQPGDLPREGRDCNFISVHLRQLEIMRDANTIVCGVVEREASTSTVCRTLISGLDDQVLAPLLPDPPGRWKKWFLNALDPTDDPESEGQRITDSLLFRCVLQPGEALSPVVIERNEMRRAPRAWADLIVRYPKPHVSYVQVSEWSAPFRLEMFENKLPAFERTAALVSHCSLLLPRYAFPVGLDIADKFAKVPNWMTRPVNTHATVQALKGALESGDTRSFDALRRLLCGSGREWLLRPGIHR